MLPNALDKVRLAEIFQEAGFPPGVLNVVHGARETVEALIAAPEVQAISFVGSAPVARRFLFVIAELVNWLLGAYSAPLV